MTGRIPSPALVLCCALLVFVGCGREPADETTGPPVADPTPTPAVPASTAPAATDTGSSPPTRSPSAAAGDAPAIPEVTGLRLAEGEELLRARGILSIDVVDASGAGRIIIEKDNWVIMSQRPEAGAAAETGVPVTLSVSKPTDPQPTINPVDGSVPDVVCRDLQTAQDALRAAGFYLLVPKDGLGQGRLPLVDRNWIVVGQSATAGSRPATSTRIELTVVKYGEPTGNSGCPS